MFRAAVELYKGLNHKNRYAEIARRKDGVYYICFNNAVYQRHYYRLTKIRLPQQ